jgi:hypothetical protein
MKIRPADSKPLNYLPDPQVLLPPSKSKLLWTFLVIGRRGEGGEGRKRRGTELSLKMTVELLQHVILGTLCNYYSYRKYNIVYISAVLLDYQIYFWHFPSCFSSKPHSDWNVLCTVIFAVCTHLFNLDSLHFPVCVVNNIFYIKI